MPKENLTLKNEENGVAVQSRPSLQVELMA